MLLLLPEEALAGCEAAAVSGVLPAASGAKRSPVHVAAAAPREVGHGLTPNLAGIKVLEKDTLRGCDVAAVQLGERRRQENDSVSVSAQLDEGAAAHVERGEAAVGALVAVEQALDSVKRLDWVVLGDELL